MSSKSRNPINFTVSEFVCIECGKEGMPIPRKANKQREKGHLKKLYCIHCQKETNHKEKRQFDNESIEEIKESILNGKNN